MLGGHGPPDFDRSVSTISTRGKIMPSDFPTFLRPCFTTSNVNISTYLLFAKFPLFDLLFSAVLYVLASLSSLSSSEDTESNIMPQINM